MRTPFRQGILSTQTGGFLFFNASGNVDLLANTRPATVLIADQNQDYFHVEDANVSNAWQGPFLPAVDYWLYWDFDTINFRRTFGHTTVEPVAQPTRPPNPVVGMHWYDTANNVHYEYLPEGFSRVFRVFAAKLNSATFSSESMDAPTFTGTQIGNTDSVLAGRILYSEFGNPLRRDDGTFFTTEDQFFTSQSQVSGVRLESNVVRGKSDESSIAEFQIVSFNTNGNMQLASYNDVEIKVIAVVTENLALNEVGNVIIQGSVTNPAWDWSSFPSGTRLWVDNGELTPVDPHIVDPVANPKPQVPVAKVLFRDTIIFEQGLGGVGPVGPQGSVDNLPAASDSNVGGVFLTVPPVNSSIPKAVSDNDPRLANAPFAGVAHIHPGIDITITPSGNISASNAQEAIEELDATKFTSSGGTISGSITVTDSSIFNDRLTVASNGIEVSGPSIFNDVLTLSADPILPLEAVTKRYVDQLTSGLLWLDPVCLVNLISDAISDPTGLNPEDGDAYLLPAAGTGDWLGFIQQDVVRWNGPLNQWVNGGQISSSDFPSSRFIIAGSSSSPASGTLTGRENDIATWNGTSFTFETPIDTNTVYVCNNFSAAAYNEYTFDLNQSKWVQTGGSRTGVTADGITINQIGNVFSTKSYASGGMVDAATYRGQDLDTVFAPIVHNHNTVYSQLGHVHAASVITFSPISDVPGFGSPFSPTSDDIVATEVQAAIAEVFAKKANIAPYYGTVTDLPTANTVPGMLATTDDDKTPRVSVDGQWQELAINDGTVQDHQHRINYDLTFYSAGPVATIADKILGRTIVPRNIDIPPNSLIYARVINPPTNSIDFQIAINGTLTSMIVTFAPAINGGLFVNGTTGSGTFSLVPGDYIDLLAPNTVDVDISDMSLTIVAVANTGTP